MVSSTPLPKSPVFEWASLRLAGVQSSSSNSVNEPPSVVDLPNRVFTSSGRAALHAALVHMQLPLNSAVLVPSYHCPTMVAPVLEAGHRPHFYALDEEGLPRLDAIDVARSVPRAMFVAHYFGITHDLSHVRRWCEKHDVLLVEDCAHSCFGRAGARPVGHWGDYAITSLSKFYPVPEAGVLASLTRSLANMPLQPTPWRREVKTIWDVLHHAHDHERLGGLSLAMRAALWFRPRADRSDRGSDTIANAEVDVPGGCDMGRIRETSTGVSRWIHRKIPRATIVEHRRRNHARYCNALHGLAGVRVMSPLLSPDAAPYVLPLWVDDARRADALYARMRANHWPVFRWDRVWPSTPALEHDSGASWRRQVLQLLCHQSLRDHDVSQVAQGMRAWLEANP